MNTMQAKTNSWNDRNQFKETNSNKIKRIISSSSGTNNNNNRRKKTLLVFYFERETFKKTLGFLLSPCICVYIYASLISIHRIEVWICSSTQTKLLQPENKLHCNYQSVTVEYHTTHMWNHEWVVEISRMHMVHVWLVGEHVERAEQIKNMIIQTDRNYSDYLNFREFQRL